MIKLHTFGRLSLTGPDEDEISSVLAQPKRHSVLRDADAQRSPRPQAAWARDGARRVSGPVARGLPTGARERPVPEVPGVVRPLLCRRRFGLAGGWVSPGVLAALRPPG